MTKLLYFVFGIFIFFLLIGIIIISPYDVLSGAIISSIVSFLTVMFFLFLLKGEAK